MSGKYIIDVDTGVDDAQAILLALSRPDVEILAITCVAGNCGVEQVCLNTLKVLTVCSRLEVPVFRGACQALSGEGIEATHYHGNDGMGDADLDIKVSLDQLQKEHAVTALIRLVNENPGEITLVALAPLTNIAMALRMDPEFGKKLKHVTVMGGNTEGRGNSTLCGEFNFVCDPEAAKVVLTELHKPITLIPWEINLTSATGVPWDWFDTWISVDTTIGRFNKSISQLIQHKQRIVNKAAIYRSCDLNAMVTVVDPDIILEKQQVYATVELHGTHTRGMMVIDWRKVLGKEPNVTLVKLIDTEKARKFYDEMIK